MEDVDVVPSQLAHQAPFVKLAPEQKQRVRELVVEIKAIFDAQVKKAS